MCKLKSLSVSHHQLFSEVGYPISLNSETPILDTNVPHEVRICTILGFDLLKVGILKLNTDWLNQLLDSIDHEWIKIRMVVTGGVMLFLYIRFHGNSCYTSVITKNDEVLYHALMQQRSTRFRSGKLTWLYFFFIRQWNLGQPLLIYVKRFGAKMNSCSRLYIASIVTHIRGTRVAWWCIESMGDSRMKVFNSGISAQFRNSHFELVNAGIAQIPTSFGTVI